MGHYGRNDMLRHVLQFHIADICQHRDLGPPQAHMGPLFEAAEREVKAEIKNIFCPCSRGNLSLPEGREGETTDQLILAAST